MTLNAAVLKQRRLYQIEHPTYAEVQTKRILRDLRVIFQYQKIIGPFIVDFVVGRKIIELDGSVHDDREGYDDQRSAFLFSRGYDVYRIANSEISSEVVQKILST